MGLVTNVLAGLEKQKKKRVLLKIDLVTRLVAFKRL